MTSLADILEAKQSRTLPKSLTEKEFRRLQQESPTKRGRLLSRAIARTTLPSKEKYHPHKVQTGWKEEVVINKRGFKETQLNRVFETIVPPIEKEWR